MTGTALHSRTLRITSSPSRSGSPRSRMTMSGWRLATSTSPSAPVAASCTRKPWPANAARTKRRICGSSSTTTTQGSGRASPTRILDQVDEHLLDEQAIDVHGRQVLGQPGRQLAVAQRRGEPRERHADQLLDGNPLAAQLQVAGLQARDVEQVVDEAVEPLGLVADRLEQLAARDGIDARLALQRRTGGAGDGGERRAGGGWDGAGEGHAPPPGPPPPPRPLR